MKRSDAVRRMEAWQATKLEDETDIGDDDWGLAESQEDFANMSNEDLANRMREEGVGDLEEGEEIEDDDAEPGEDMA